MNTRSISSADLVGYAIARGRCVVQLILARRLATRARRARLVGALEEIRHVGAQLDALDPASPEAPAVLDATITVLDRNADVLEAMGA